MVVSKVDDGLVKMNKWFKASLISLTIATILLIGLSYASHGDLRDYYPYGLEVKAEQLTTAPSTYTMLQNDTYIEQAITNGNWTWVQQDDSSSEFMSQGLPTFILWLPNGNYYRIHQQFSDGIPESWKLMPKPTTTVALLTIPWTILFLIGIHRKKNRAEPDRRYG